MRTIIKGIMPIRFSVIILFLFLFSLSSSVKLNLPPPEGKYKILMLLPFASQSHRNCFLPLAESLADRGHQVTILSPLPPKSKNPNIKEINHGAEAMNESLSMFTIREVDPTGGFAFFKDALPIIITMYDNPEVMELYNKRDEFDLMLLDELFNEPAYPFLAGKRFATIATAGIMPPSSAILGNVLNPSYIPSVMFDYPRPYSFMQRFANLLAHLYLPIYWRHWEIFPLIEKELSKRFPNLPPPAEIEKGICLVLANTHFALDFPMPLLPSQVEVGGMHCHPGKPLPKDLQTFIDGAGPDGVVYFSLGSVCKGKTIPEKFKKILLEAFSQLKQRVIWKFEDEFKDLPKNIMISKWLPQQDILAHPNVKLFITHGGLLSMQESIYHGKPLLALPIFGDQLRNGQRILNKHFGKFLIWEDLTVDLVKSTIDELINDLTYKNGIEKVSAAFRDQQFTSLEKAIWWTEYVIRHKGAPQLKSPGAELSWIEYLMIDIIVVIFLIFFILYWVIKKLICFIKCHVFGSSKSDSSQKRKKE